MTRALRVAGVMAAVLVALAIYRGNDSSAASADTVVVSFGDRIRIDRTPVGCRVSRLVRHENQVFMDCRRAGPLKGTYGTYVGERDVVVVRFVDGRTAKVVYQARHGGVGKTCD
jgi:hypothetical protein